MARNIGFVKPPQVWEGPEFFRFDRVVSHSQTVRYHCFVGDRKFDFYVPYLLLPQKSRKQPPEKLSVAIARWKEDDSSTMFPPDAVCGEPGAFRFFEYMKNSRLYRLDAEGRSYKLYVPDDVFGVKREPERLVVQAAVP